MERVKVLSAALALGEFTVDELVSLSGVRRSTVRSVLRRSLNSGMVKRSGAEGTGRLGRPPARWAIRDCPATREFAATIKALAPAPASPVSAEGRREAAVGVAEQSLRVLPEHDPVIQRRILRAARAGLNLVDGSSGSEPWWAGEDSAAAIRARAIDSLAALATAPEEPLTEAALRDVTERIVAVIRAAPGHAEALYSSAFTAILAARGELAPPRMVAPETREIPTGLVSGAWIEALHATDRQRP